MGPGEFWWESLQGKLRMTSILPMQNTDFYRQVPSREVYGGDWILKVLEVATTKWRNNDPGQVLAGIMNYDSSYGSSHLCTE